MRILILLLIVTACAVSAKYLPDSNNSNQLLNRYKRSDSEESVVSSEDNNSNSNDDDDDEDGGDVISQEKIRKEQSKRLIKLEKSRLKLLEKQEKENRKHEEEQRKLEEKIAKELRKEEEKRQKEEHRREEKLEKERQKMEETQRKFQEKLLKKERKLQEKTEKQLKEIEESTFKMQEVDVNISELDSDDSIELEDFWKNRIYSKYGITEFNNNLEKKAALRRYMQEELGLKANSTANERRQAVLNLINSKLQTTSEQNELQNQLVNYITKLGVQKIRANLEKDIEELKNKTEILNNVNLPWVPVAKQNFADQVLFLESVKDLLSNILPNWLIESETQVHAATNSDIDSSIVKTVSSPNENSSHLNITFDSKTFTTDIKVPNPALINNNFNKNVEHTSFRLPKIGDNILVLSTENSTSSVPSFKKNGNAAAVSNDSSIVSESSSSGPENSQMPLNELTNSKGGSMTTDISSSTIINNYFDIATSNTEVPTNSKEAFSSEGKSSDLISKLTDSNSNKIISSDTAQSEGSKNVTESTYMNKASLNINTPNISALEGKVSDPDLISNNTNGNISNTGNNIFESPADNITSSASVEKTGNAVSDPNDDESNITVTSSKIISSPPYNNSSKVAADSQNLSSGHNRITEFSTLNAIRPEGSLNENNTDLSQNTFNISSIDPTLVNKNTNIIDNGTLFEFSSSGNGVLSTNDNEGNTLSGVTSAGFGIASTSVDNITTANLSSDKSENTISVSTDLSNASEPSSHYLGRNQPSVFGFLNSKNAPQIIRERGNLPPTTTGIASDTMSPFTEVASDANSLFSSQSDSSDLVNTITGSPPKIISPNTEQSKDSENATKSTNVDSMNISYSESKAKRNMIASNETGINISKVSQSIVTENDFPTSDSSISNNEIQEPSKSESIDTTKFVPEENPLAYIENNATAANNDHQTSNLSNVLSVSSKYLKTVSGNPNINVADQSRIFTVETADNGLKMVNNFVSPHILELTPIGNSPSNNENYNVTVVDNAPNISNLGSTDSTLVQPERKIATHDTNISVGDVPSSVTNTPIIVTSNAVLKENEISLTSADDGSQAIEKKVTTDEPFVKTNIVSEVSTEQTITTQVTEQALADISTTAESDILKSEAINGEKLSILKVPVPAEHGAFVINITKQ